MSINVDYCSFEAAKYAVMNWHYSETMPKGKLVYFGVWDDEEFFGAIIFGKGANRNIYKPYGLGETDVCELVRVALKSDHAFPTSQVVAASVKRLHKTNPGLRLIVSYADPQEGHHGGIYQAMNWMYTGPSGSTQAVKIDDDVLHPRSVFHRFGTNNLDVIRQKVSNIEVIKQQGKHRYLLPLDKAMRRRIERLSVPYPQKQCNINERRAEEVSKVTHPTSCREMQVRSLSSAPTRE